ncbi:MAG: hypothetical protein KF868_05280 [Acidobacteria bacterium]|nr:hypothetical protein [Acidobacteriota bacterium]MCW5971524.1 hypothetical protein [Blastocatellales bacterium]
MTSLGLPLDEFIPQPDVQERFSIKVHAPAATVLDTACNFDMQSPRLVRMIFRMRELLMRASVAQKRKPQGLLEETRALGWGLLAQTPGLIICGATCRPWEADVTFTPIAPQEFTAFAEPDCVKIAWSLETESITPEVTVLSQETRVVSTDAQARLKFRRYWRWARFGIIAIRLLLLPAVRREAEKRWRKSGRPRQ